MKKRKKFGRFDSSLYFFNFFSSDRVEFCSFSSGLRLSIHLGRHSRGRGVPLRRQRVLAADALHAGIEIDHVEGKVFFFEKGKSQSEPH